MAIVRRLTENDLTRIVKLVIKEQTDRKYTLINRDTKEKITFVVKKEYKTVKNGTTTVWVEGISIKKQNFHKIWFDCDKYNFCFLDSDCLVTGGVKRAGCTEYDNPTYLRELKNKFCSSQQYKG